MNQHQPKTLNTVDEKQPLNLSISFVDLNVFVKSKEKSNDTTISSKISIMKDLDRFKKIAKNLENSNVDKIKEVEEPKERSSFDDSDSSTSLKKQSSLKSSIKNPITVDSEEAIQILKEMSAGDRYSILSGKSKNFILVL
jgi:deoxyribodipyrimidine photolyase